MKLLLFKSKTCGICKLFEPQIKIVAEKLGIDLIPIDVEENENFNLWTNVSTIDLLNKFDIRSAGKLLFLLNENDENGAMILFERPQKSDDLLKKINELINSNK